MSSKNNGDGGRASKDWLARDVETTRGSGDWLARDVETTRGSGDWLARDVETTRGSGDWLARDVETTRGSGDWLARDVETTRGSGDWLARDVETTRGSGDWLARDVETTRGSGDWLRDCRGALEYEGSWRESVATPFAKGAFGGRTHVSSETKACIHDNQHACLEVRYLWERRTWAVVAKCLLQPLADLVDHYLGRTPCATYCRLPNDIVFFTRARTQPHFAEHQYLFPLYHKGSRREANWTAQVAFMLHGAREHRWSIQCESSGC